ncbi:hypothetical protein GCM10009839_81450 [Catenulispora yoronensis]|uniref:SGNH domain-containing protein n=1 Tax=Catenulispora yoronensis TaxID=450799 RepID=A0ABP5GYI2_9ACTN
MAVLAVFADHLFKQPVGGFVGVDVIEDRAIAAVGDSRARFVDTSAWFCSDGQCPAFADGMLIRADRLHFTAAATASTALTPFLRDALAPLAYRSRTGPRQAGGQPVGDLLPGGDPVVASSRRAGTWASSGLGRLLDVSAGMVGGFRGLV